MGGSPRLDSGPAPRNKATQEQANDPICLLEAKVKMRVVVSW